MVANDPLELIAALCCLIYWSFYRLLAKLIFFFFGGHIVFMGQLLLVGKFFFGIWWIFVADISLKLIALYVSKYIDGFQDN